MYSQLIATISMSIYLNQQFPPSMTSRIVLDNIVTSCTPALFTDQISFQVTFSVLQPIPCPLMWKIIYVGSAYSEDYDQTLEQFEIDPIENCGTLKFDIACSNPDATKIPRKELLCVTALLLTASYRSQEFIRVGYYVHNQLTGQETDNSNIDELPLEQVVKRIKRTIISDKPRVTKFNIDWSDNQTKKKISYAEDSQSKLDDYFSVSRKSKNQQLDSTSQKNEAKDNEKQSTHQESQVMISQ